MDPPDRNYKQNPNVYNQQSGPQTAQQRLQQEYLNYRFSPEELRAIGECEVEAFYARCVPFGFTLGMAAFIGVKKGILKPNSRFGAFPKVAAGVVFGYIAGRFSYQSVCREKLMKLPNSQFAQMLLRAKGKTPGDNSGFRDAGIATALSLAPFQSVTDVFEQPDALNLDTNRPNYGDEFTPTMEGTNNLDDELDIPPPKQVVTYDELRKKNREDYEKSRYRPGYGTPPPLTASPPQQNYPQQQSPSPFPEQPPLRRKTTDSDYEQSALSGPKNKYGDVWSQ